MKYSTTKLIFPDIVAVTTHDFPGINDTVMEAFSQPGEWSEGVKLVHQTGKYDFERVNSLVKSVSPRVVKSG